MKRLKRHSDVIKVVFNMDGFNEQLFINIEWNNIRHEGYMNFKALDFFPCSQKKAREIFELIKYNRSNITLDSLEEWLLMYKEMTKDNCLMAEKDYVCVRTEAAEAKTRADAFFHLNGRLVSEMERISRDNEYKEIQRRANRLLKEAKSLHRKFEKIGTNIEILRKVRCK